MGSLFPENIFHFTRDELQAAELTVRGFGVVFPKGLVLGNVWVEEAQRVLGNVLRRHHLVGADDVWQGDG